MSAAGFGVASDTVARYQFNNTLADTSGNGLNLSTLNGNTQHTAGGTEQYTTIAGGSGFLFDGGTKLWAPFSSLFLLTGDFTIEWLMYQPSNDTSNQTYFCAALPGGRVGGAGPDRIGSLYTLFFSNGTIYTNENIGSNIPVANYGAFTGTGNSTYANGAWHAYAFRRSGTAMSVFADGARIAPDVTDITPNTANGTERFFVGGFEGGSECMLSGVVFGSTRISNTAHSNTQVSRDAFVAVSPPAPVSATTATVQFDAIAAARIGSVFRYQPQSWTGFSNQAQTAPGLQV